MITQNDLRAVALTPALGAIHQPEWPDLDVRAQVVEELTSLPPLVFPDECDLLTSRLADVSRGEAFVLTGGDCAETFAENTPWSIKARMNTVLQMAVVLTYAATLPVVKMGRIAGQYFKPRSAATEVIDGVEMLTYRGDAINDIARDSQARTPDPRRMLEAYRASSATLNLIRAFTQDGSADLRMVHSWNRDFVSNSAAGAKYEQLAADIDRALSFINACGADPAELRGVEFFTAHEALLLDYERALARVDWRTGLSYASSAHFLWLGERTRDLDGAHVAFARTIRNPVGVKIGPKANPDDVVSLVRLLDPDRTPGRLTLITRMGSQQVRSLLPPLVEKVEAGGHPVVWVCDPMHGNTREASTGHKTRYFADVVDEVAGFFAVHRELGSHPGGLHVELTGDHVTECIGGTAGVDESDLASKYETACDPRLNRVQALELAFMIAESFD